MLTVSASAQTTYYDGDVSVSTLNSSTGDLNVLGFAEDYQCGTFTGTEMFIGNLNSNNTLTIQNGADVDCSKASIGTGSRDYMPERFSNGNTVTVTGAGSTWTSGYETSYSGINIGYVGSSNTLNIENGGTVNSGAVTLGYFVSSSHSNSLNVNGGTLNIAGTTAYDADLNMRVGTGHAVTVSNGGTVNCQRIMVGEYATYNKMTVTGSGSSVTARFGTTGSDVWIGNYASNNSIEILAGARMSAGWVSLGYNTGNNNSLLVSGAGSRLLVSGIDIGAASTGNKLTIQNGALVVADGSIGGSTKFSIGNGIGNRLQLAGGFIAVKDDTYGAFDMAQFLTGERIEVWDGTAYVLADASMVTVFHCDSAGDAASALGEYSTYYSEDLLNTLDGGFTILTGGSVVPEPAACAAFAGLGALSLALLRRRAIAKR